MKTMKFGNWSVDDKGIHWMVDDEEGYFISLNQLLKERKDGNIGLYDWLIHVAEKSRERFKPADIFAFNTAFFYALDASGIGFTNNLSIAETLILQQDEL
jgi:hypothetical protein